MTNQYFQGLNYSLANEDTWIEYKLAPENAQSFFCVCGSGSRVIPLLAKNPKKLHIVDLSSAQLRLFRLRISAIKVLSYDEYLFFLGYRQKNEGLDRRILLNKLGLDGDDLKYWNYFEKDWKNDGFIYLGRWERHFMKLGKFYQKIFLKNLFPLFETTSQADQLKRLPHLWSKKLFNFYTNIVLNPWVANKMLYKGHFAGSEEKRTNPLSAADYVAHEFNDLFETTWVKSNYFLQLIFLGKVFFKEAFPAECDVELFNKIKINTTEIFYHQENLLTLLKQSPHDFYSLSDTFSYMSDSEVSSFLTGLPESVPLGAQIIIRTFMRKPHFKVELPWKTDQELNMKLAKDDCTRMYEFCVLKKF
jgi:S-adenosylmethionine-diacylglycerol 3-amino-3-carboxypropyl transferase